MKNDPMSDSRSAIPVVLSVYDPSGDYSRHAGVVLTSLFSNTKSSVRAIILHDATLSPKNREKLCRTGENYGQAVEFIDVSGGVAQINADPDGLTKNFSRGALFRLLIPDLLDLPKVIYLDCDVVVNLDIRELWDVPIGEACLAAARDISIIAKSKKLHGGLRRWAMRHDASRYFNSGVLVMNLARIREKGNLANEAFRFFERYAHCADLLDQDFLNTLFRDEILLIEDRFQSRESVNVENSILHLTGGGYKPWTLHRATERDRLYWETLARSEWRDRLVGDMLEVYRNNPLTHFRTSDCVRRICNRWKKDLFTGNTITRLFGDLGLLATELRRRRSDKRSGSRGEVGERS